MLYNLQEEMKNELPVASDFNPVVVKEEAGDALVSLFLYFKFYKNFVVFR